ncbi:MAG: tyrosine-type recombinase/integrase, partial [Nanoarchaeota archaeon]
MNELIKTGATKDAIMKRLNPGYAKEAAKFLDHVQREGITADSVKDFVAWLDTENYSAATVNKHLSAIKKTMKILFDSPSLTELQKYQLEKFLSEIKSRKISKGEKAITTDKTLTDSELKKMINCSPKRSSLLLEFLFFTAARVSEALNIKFGDIKKQTTDYVYFRILGKGLKERTVKIPIDLYYRIIETFQGKVFLFESKSGNKLHDRNIAKEFKRLGEKYIDRAVNPHMFRHTRATQLIRKTGKIKAVSEYLGHSTAAITLDMYVHE